MSKHRTSKRIIWYEIAGFAAIVGITWADEFLGFPRRLLAERIALDWSEALAESAIVLFVAVPTIFLTWRQSRRLHRLEGFLHVCSWCHKVGGEGDDWVALEEFALTRLNTRTTHGICPECLARVKTRMEGRSTWARARQGAEVVPEESGTKTPARDREAKTGSTR